MGVVKTQGTEMYVVAEEISPEVQLLGCITGIDGLGGAAGQIDTTCFNSIEMEYEGGMNNPGQVTISGVYKTTDTTFPNLVALKRTKTVVGWYIGGNDGTDPPTADSNFLVVPPTNRTGIDFRGYIADLTWQLQQNNVWRWQVVVQRSGEWDLTPKV